MNYKIIHMTQYAYKAPVQFSYNETRLRPRQCPLQSCIEHCLQIEPIPDDISERIDFFGNSAAFFSILESHAKLTVTAESTIEIQKPCAVGSVTNMESWEESRQRILESNAAEAIEARQFILESPLISIVPSITKYAERSFTSGHSLLSGTNDLMTRIHNDFEYDTQPTTVSTPPEEALKLKRGVCQDFAHFGIACLRSVGLAARYVSGYLETIPPPGREKLIGADASHAWFSVFDPTHSWIDFDPTNNLQTSDQHITLAWGRDYTDVTPLKGVIFGGRSPTLNVSVDVSAI